MSKKPPTIQQQLKLITGCKSIPELEKINIDGRLLLRNAFRKKRTELSTNGKSHSNSDDKNKLELVNKAVELGIIKREGNFYTSDNPPIKVGSKKILSEDKLLKQLETLIQAKNEDSSTK